jgi:hypothetical protein
MTKRSIKLEDLTGVGVEVVDDFRERQYYLNGFLHREDGPAGTYADGSKIYLQNGILHRLNGPAVIRADGYEAYYIYGRLHREDGPAITWANGQKAYYLYDKKITKWELILHNKEKQDAL